MLVPLNINQEDILNQFNISKQEMGDVIDFAVKEITAQFAAQWEETANKELHATRNRYTSNLRVVDEGRCKGAVLLDYSQDKVVQMIEEGASAFDIKEGFEKSTKKTMKRDGQGWYLTIPFSIGTPTASVVSGFASIMPESVYAIAKEKVVSPITNKSPGIVKNELPGQFQIPKVRAAIVIPESKTFAEYKNKHSVYEGVFKQTDSVTGQNTYGSFRRVSDKSDPNSWIHPGIEAKNLAEKALGEFEQNIEVKLGSAMDRALSYFGFG